MITHFKLKNYLLLVSFLCFSVCLTAQSLNVLPVMLKPNEVTSLPYLLVSNQEEMNKVRLAKENYPAIVMQKTIFMDVYEISLKRTQLIADLEKSNANLVKQDSISKHEIQAQKDLVALYQKQLSESEALNLRLNNSIKTLDTNFNTALKIVERNEKKERWQKAKVGLLGTALGFCAATLWGAFTK